MADEHQCPRREEGPWTDQGPDTWRDDKTCSYCGSLHPDELMNLIEDGAEIGPTDKNYKCYVKHASRGFTKFYYQHLGEEQKKRFIELVRTQVMKIGYPGYFY